MATPPRDTPHPGRLTISRHQMWPKPARSSNQPREGFIGTSLEKDEYLLTCSSIDDVIIFTATGATRWCAWPDKLFVGKNIIHIGLFRKADTRTIYNAIYQDGKGGTFTT